MGRYLNTWRGTCRHGGVPAGMGRYLQAWGGTCRHGEIPAGMGRYLQTWGGTCRHGEVPASMGRYLQAWEGTCKHGEIPADMGRYLQAWGGTCKHGEVSAGMGRHLQAWESICRHGEARVSRLPKEQSERQKGLDVLPPRGNFVVNPDKFFIYEIHWGADPPLIKLRGGSMRPGIPPSFFNVPASCLPSPKPAPRPPKVEDQQLRYFLLKDKITSFDAFKPKHNLQKQYKNLIILRSKERLVGLFMTDNFTCVDTQKEKKLVFLTRQLELLSQKLFSMNDYCFALQSYPKCNNGQLKDFLVLPCKRKLQYITFSIDKDQLLKETFDKVQTLQQKNVFLLVDEVQIRLNTEEFSPSSDL
ncbi:hypothetical protein FHG87_009944 [Trinorchestia longiramus]|nr:hypothetical protein FHG87_009944 [Trinorchestia longiramus]